MSHLAVLEAKHVQYPDEAVSGVSEGLTEYGEGLAGLADEDFDLFKVDPACFKTLFQ